jgi:uncharacterized protein YyaL (SSP411 family)
MLYDNALLTLALLECYQVTGNQLYKGLIERTLVYIQHEMTSPEGGFYTAQDADIDGIEGKFYVFTQAEITEVLGQPAAETFCKHYGITAAGNFEEQNILNLLHHPNPQLPTPEREKQLEMLLQYRSQRYQLHKDDKILLAWNALMITACAKAYQALSRREYLDMAIGAYNFLWKNLRASDGKLFISYRARQVKGQGLLDDYAFLAWAALELYQSTFEADYLQQAEQLMEQVLTRFTRTAGGFYLTPQDGEALLFRPFDQYDGAMPSGNSVAALCLTRLAALSGETRWQEAAEQQLQAYSKMFNQRPSAASFALLALLQQSFPSQELLCIMPDDESAGLLSLEWGQHFQPQTSIITKTPQQAELLAQIAPYTASYPAAEKPTFYLCKNYSCAAPVHDFAEVISRLESQK